MASTFYCGIDLGTTNSTLSVIEIKMLRDDPIKNLKTVPIYQYNRDFNGIDKAQTLLPSYLFFKVGDKSVYTGHYAKHVYSLGDRPMQTVTAVKTRIGSDSSVVVPDYETGATQEFDMTQCSSLLLRTIFESFKEQYGEEIENVVITVPAAFNTDEREATMNAALLAGFKKAEILDEPTATLLYFINGGESALNDLGEENTIEDDDYVLVYDLGGGTLDVCIARITDDEDSGDSAIEILSRSPREDFGGNDFDQQLASYFLYEWERARESIENRSVEAQNAIISRLVSHAENYKIELNEKILDKIDSPRMLQRVKTEAVFEVMSGMKVDMSINKESLDQVFWSLTEPSGPILKPVKSCLGEAGLRPEDISMVVMTGGMTKYYAVRKAIEDFFGNSVRIVEVDAQNSVSKGAAIHSYNSNPRNHRLKKLSIQDRMADDIFIRVHSKFLKLIPRETSEGSGIFEYEIPEDRMLRIPIFLYHGLNEHDPASFTPIAGKYIDLPKDYKKGEIIKLQWTIDKNKIIHITLPGMNEELEISNSGLLSAKEIRENLVVRYKINPR